MWHKPQRSMTLVLSSVRAFPNNPREHPEGQIARLTNSIPRVWTNPILSIRRQQILQRSDRLRGELDSGNERRWLGNN